MKKLFSILCMCLLVLSGCGSSNSSGGETRTITDVRGEVTIPANPQRVVDLSGNSDMLELLGFNVVGTANSDAYDQTKLPSYLDGYLSDAKILGYNMNADVSIEEIINLNPDLIIISTIQDTAYDQLSQVAPTVEIQLEQLDWKKDFTTLGSMLGKEEVAKEWLKNYEELAKTKGNEIKDVHGDQTYLTLLASGGQLFVLQEAGIGGVMYNDMGLKRPENMPEQTGIELPVISYEGLSEINPDYLMVVATDSDKQALEANSVYQNMEAVKNNKVTMLNSSPYFNQGYSVVGRELFVNEVGDLIK